jgi:hypothetical protein
MAECAGGDNNGRAGGEFDNKLEVPRAVMAHQPNGRLPESTWSKQHVAGPKLKVAQANMLLRKLRWRRGYVLKRGPR